jgi:branched-chain amino acid transport system permease protein
VILATAPTTVQPYITAIVVGIGTGCMYALIALSYNLIFNATGVFNLAQGDLLTLGGLLAYSLLVTHNLAVLLVVVPVALGVAAVGFLQERLTIAPLVKRGETSFGWIITTLGASVVLENIFQLTWGSQPKPVPNLISRTTIHLWNTPIAVSNLLITAVAIAIAAGLELWSRKTLAGNAWMATSEDGQAAILRGINVRRVGSIAFVVAGGISGLGGLITAPVTSAVFNAGALLSLYGFVAIVIGGFGSQAGALVGGIILGIVEAEALLFLDAGWSDVIALAVLLIVLMVRPTGLFGYRQEREV